MVLFNYATKELTAKVVYYGPGLCGKTTNLQFIYDTLPTHSKGKMLSLATKTDRTLFFDFLPIDLGTIRGMKTKIQLYTVPGQVFYDTTRKLVLKGADGVVFVADSQAAVEDANIDSFENLVTNLAEQNMAIENMPHVLQFNKRDMKHILSVEELSAKLNRHGVPCFEAVATKGEGVFETLKGISKLVLKHLGRKYGLEEDAAAVKKGRPNVKIPDLPPQPSAKKTVAPTPEPKAAPTAAPISKPIQKLTPPPEARMEEIEFIEDDTINKVAKNTVDSAGRPRNPAPASRSLDNTLEPISTIDDSEVIELDDVDPLEIEELDDMAEIANMASESPAPAASMVTPIQAPEELPPIEVPVSINLPSSLAGKPLRLQIDISFED